MPSDSERQLAQYQFEADRVLGTGSYSVVRKSRHRHSNELVAAKIIDKHKLSSRDRKALRQEIQLLELVGRDDPEHVLQLHEVIETQASVYLMTELLEGGDLFDTVVRANQVGGGGGLGLDECARIMSCLVSAIVCCHDVHNVLHRDIKLENIFLQDDRVKLGDFGFAIQLKVGQEEIVGETCGTPGYAAPELVQGQAYGKPIDLFSLGVVAYILCCGVPPFPMNDVTNSNHDSSHVLCFRAKDWKNSSNVDDVQSLIRSLLSPNPKDRPTISTLAKHPWIQAGHAVQAARMKKASAPSSSRLKSLHERLVFPSSVAMVKFGRQGLAHDTTVSLVQTTTTSRTTAAEWYVEWQSKTAHFLTKKKKNKLGLNRIRLGDITEIHAGHQTKVFERLVNHQGRDHPPSVCFSLVTRDRTLDLATRTTGERDQVVALFQDLVESCRETSFLNAVPVELLSSARIKSIQNSRGTATATTRRRFSTSNLLAIAS